jgi:hypothetical protein
MGEANRPGHPYSYSSKVLGMNKKKNFQAEQEGTILSGRSGSPVHPKETNRASK